jgi:hypothetical protein
MYFYQCNSPVLQNSHLVAILQSLLYTMRNIAGSVLILSYMPLGRFYRHRVHRFQLVLFVEVGKEKRQVTTYIFFPDDVDSMKNYKL